MQNVRLGSNDSSLYPLRGDDDGGREAEALKLAKFIKIKRLIQQIAL
jgi:hypothetical protein